MKQSSSPQGSKVSITEEYRDKKMASLRDKLVLEWKNIYRGMCAVDGEAQSGIVTLKDFERIVHLNRVFVNKDEIKHLKTYFGANGGQQIKYADLSLALGLNSNTITMISN